MARFKLPQTGEFSNYGLCTAVSARAVDGRVSSEIAIVHCRGHGRRTTANIKGKTYIKIKGRGQERPRHTLIRGDGEVHCDAGFSFYGLAVLKIWLEMPLLHGLAGGDRKNGRPAQNLQFLDGTLARN